jgi:D-3-phosphoglycerate dehydrogenase
VVAALEPYSYDIFDKHKGVLKIVSRIGTGVDNINVIAARTFGIKIETIPEAPVQSVTELTIAMMINLCRHIHIANNEIHTGNWNPRMGHRLSERKIGILGYGRIGSNVARSLEVFTSNPIMHHDIIAERSNCTLEELFRNCDLITIHIPLEGNREFVNRKLLNVMPGGSFLINNARGKIINESDVINALESNKLAGYAADTLDPEPYTGHLASMPNVLLTPHIGSHTIETRKEMNEGALKKCIDFLSDNKTV